MIFKDKPIDFIGTLHVVACYMVYEGRFVVLKRQTHKKHADTWGLPAGKVEINEECQHAMVREILEETGVGIDPSDLHRCQPLWVRNNDNEFVYHTFTCNLISRPDIRINQEEHVEYRWVDLSESRTLPLIHDLEECNMIFESALLGV